MITKALKLCILAFIIVPVLVQVDANDFETSHRLQERVKPPPKNASTIPGVPEVFAKDVISMEVTTSVSLTIKEDSVENTQAKQDQHFFTKIKTPLQNFGETYTAANLQQPGKQLKTETFIKTEISPEFPPISGTSISALESIESVVAYTEVPNANFENKLLTEGTNADTTKENRPQAEMRNAKEKSNFDYKLNAGNMGVSAITTNSFAFEEKSESNKETDSRVGIQHEHTTTPAMSVSATTEIKEPRIITNKQAEDISTIPASPTLTTTANKAVHIEGKLKNGLYRIKLAEIVTDEFSSLPAEDPVAEQYYHGSGRNVVATMPINAPDEQQHDANEEASSNIDQPAQVHSIYSKMEEFNPIIRDSNAKLLLERTIFTRANVAEHRQNLLPNEVEVLPQLAIFATPTTLSKPQHSLTRPKTVNGPLRMPNASHDSITDFTGKLLAEQDGIITEIEQKFRLNEFEVSEPLNEKISTTIIPSTKSLPVDAKDYLREDVVSKKLKQVKFGFSVNHKKPLTTREKVIGAIKSGGGHDFIDRRVKKSFDFPMHRASDVMAMPHVDFANTKFNTDNNGHLKSNSNASLSEVGGPITHLNLGTHPEFSTTKFYNSKELYNEMLLHSQQKPKLVTESTTISTTRSINSTSNSFTTNASRRDSGWGTVSKSISNSNAGSSRFASLHSLNFRSPKGGKDIFGKSNQKVAVVTSYSTSPPFLSIADKTPTQRIIITPEPPVTTSKISELSTSSQPKRKKYHKELKRAKLLLNSIKSISDILSTTSSTSGITNASADTPRKSLAEHLFERTPAAENHSPDAASTSSTLTLSANITNNMGEFSSTPQHFSNISDNTSNAPSTTTTPTMELSTRKGLRIALGQYIQLHPATNLTKSAAKPITRPRTLSRLQEKINALECEVQSVSQDSHLWRGNETHELLLPIMVDQNCSYSEEGKCTSETLQPSIQSWDGEAEIQSGDILIVEINDALLNPQDRKTTSSAYHSTQVYQVTRSGHEHCDVTEGILLDITPLVVDGRKLVTLYDKDLTEGVNLLIELWGTQCIRLKVTTKTDNCGENADCSGKGICYSNAGMEGYECQCCSGFAGPHCEEIDACTPSPCTNNGICVDLSQGHEGNSYQCLCPYGYTGKNCQYESDPCNPAECMNGGSCVGNSTHFRCDCTAGFTGPLCQHSLNECESSPCVHGICVDQEDGFRCFCQPGFAGELCDFEYNECESNPCQSGGECIDHIGSYECRCTKGYTGNRCQNKVDFCTNKPCPEGHRCIDHGNEFSCECPGGRNGPDCNQMPRTQCNVNPCTHGGTCWSSGDSFYCACRPGYTGTMCEDEFVVETVVSSSEFMVDDTSTRNFNDKAFGSAAVLKSPIELHNAYFAAGVLAAAIFIVAIVLAICHCKVNQTYRKFSARSTSFFPILGFGRRSKSQGKLNKHWLNGKGLGLGSGSSMRSSSASLRGNSSSSSAQYTTAGSQQIHHGGGQMHERPFQRHLAMNLENDMYYTVDFSENSQHSPLIQ